MIKRNEVIRRIVKTKKEIYFLKKSAEIANSCIPIIEEALKEDNITEKEIVRRIRKQIRKHNATFSFVPIVACGKRSAKIHPKPRSTNKIIDGIGYVDFGACFNGYRSDITVPFIKGEISKKERKIAECVLKAYELAIKSIKIGMPCWKLYEKVENFLNKNKLKIGHSLGHGIGLKVHELPYIWKPRKNLSGKKLKKWMKLKNLKFQNNMVFTIEPGVYIKGVGGCRIENEILIENENIKILTHSKLIKI